MKHKIAAGIITAMLFTATMANAQIPSHPNKTDTRGQRQGKWTILFDKDWSPITDPTQVEFYRLISYKNDLPFGIVRDYYKNGTLQFSAMMKSDRPEEVYHGTVSWFSAEGKKEAEAEFVDGQAKKLTAYGEDGTAITDSVSVLTKNGVSAYQANKIQEAISIFEKAQLRAKYESGVVSMPYLMVINYLGNLYYNIENYVKAEPYFQEASKIYLTAFGDEHPNYALSLCDLGRLYNSSGEYKKAESYYYNALEIFKKKLSPDDTDLITTATSLAGVYRKTEQFDKAELLLKGSLESVIKTKGKESLEYITSLNTLALLYTDKAENAKATQLLLELKELITKVMGKENLTYTNVLNNLAEVYRSEGYYNKAISLLEEALEIKLKISNKGSSTYATALNNLAQLYSDVGAFEKAEPMYRQVLQILENTVGKNHPFYASALGNLGEFYSLSAQYTKAEPLYKEAVRIKAAALGKENSDYALSLNNLALYYYETGDYTKAEPLLLESKEIHNKVYGQKTEPYSTSLSNLAALYLDMGDLKRAEALQLEATEIRKYILGEDNPALAISYNNLGDLYNEISDTSKAIMYFKKSAIINLKVYGHDHNVYATSLNNIGFVYSKMGQYDQAEKFMREALMIREKLLGKSHPDYAMSLNNLGGLFSEIENYQQAEPLYLDAKAIREKTLGKGHPSYSSSLSLLAGLYEKMGDHKRAEPYYLESITQIINQIIKHFPALSEKEKEAFYKDKQRYFRNFESFALNRYSQNPDILNQWYNVQLATKALLLNKSNKMRQRILQSTDKELIELFNLWQAKKDFLAKVYQMPVAEKQRKELSETRLEEEANTIEKQLSIKSELFSTAEDKRAYLWQDVQAKLRKGEVAIEIIRTIQKKAKQETTVYAALLIKSGTKKNPEIIVLENGDELENKFSRYYRNAVKQKIKDEVSYIQYWKPIAAKLKGVKKVYFSADGVYNQINLNTLFNPATGKYLIDETEIQVVTSTKNLIAQKKLAIPEISNATLFGYPNYNNSIEVQSDSSRSLFINRTTKTSEIKSDTTQRFFNGDNINELPGTKVEVESIQALLKKKGITPYQFMFNEATELQMKKLNNPQVLHIATHGFFLSDISENINNGQGFAGMETRKIVENPLLRSGLLFAGVKNAFTETGKANTHDGEDGILTSYEAMSLDLDQTDLVVMSACETGLGITRNGEGVYGLQRAFQVAGAKSVLMSLWTVSDEATQKLMTMFYENWLEGNNPRKAFRMAQLSLREKYPEPYYWGAFVLVGY